ncbi:MAG: flagellar filament capping protein FliD [Thermincolia bacterium]
MVTGINSYYSKPYLSKLFGANPAMPPTFINPLAVIPPDSKNPLRTYFQDKLGQSLQGLNQKARTLQTGASPLVSKINSIFDKRTVTSSDKSVLTATVKDKAALTNYDVQVSQLSAAQKNSGTDLITSAVTTLAAGTYNFNVTKGEKTTALSLAVTGTETNETLLKNMAKAINDASLGMTASIVSSGGNSKIELVSNTTGTKSSFSLTDTTGTLVANTGINHVTTTAADANYTVNGTQYNSHSNTGTLDNGRVTLTFLKTGATKVNLKIDQDAQALADGVDKFISDYNSFRQYLSDYSQYLHPRMASTLDKAFSVNRYNLSDLGITKDTDGELQLDRSNFIQAATTDYNNVKEVLSDTEGLPAAAYRQATMVATAPTASFVRPQMGLNTYNPFSKGLFNSTELNKGLLLNLWF